ncbi:hypothetical protein Tco_1353211 [Tanacetum coccineum]
MDALKFAETHNLVAFLKNSVDSEDSDQVIDFLNASSIRYALTVNPVILVSHIDYFWSTSVVKKNNGQLEIHALIDGRKIMVTEATIRDVLQFNDEGGIECLPNTTIFAELERMGYEKISQKLTFYKAFFSPQWKFLIHTILQCLSAKTTAWNEFSSTVASAIICLATNQKFNFSKFIMEGMLRNIEAKAGKFLMYPRFVQLLVNKLEGLSTHHRKYVVPYYTKKVFANMKRANKEFSGKITPLFCTMVVQAQAPTVTISPTHIPTPVPTLATTSTQPSQPHKQRVRRPVRRETEPTEVLDVPANSNNPLSGEDRLKLMELTNLCTALSSKVLSLEATKTSQAKEIAMLKKRVKRLEKGKKSSSSKLKRLLKVGTTTRVQSSEDKDTVLDANLFGVHDLGGEEVFADKTVEEEMTLAQTLMDIKTKAKGIAIQEPSDSAPVTSQPTQVKAQDKGKVIMVEETVVLKRKDQIAFDAEIAQKLQEQFHAEMEVEARHQREKEEEASNAALVAKWDEIQARIDADYELAEQLQTQEQEELTMEEKSKLFVELMEKRKKYFAKLRAEEKRRKPLTQAQRRNQMSTYLKNMAGYTLKQLKGKTFKEIKEAFERTMK